MDSQDLTKTIPLKISEPALNPLTGSPSLWGVQMKTGKKADYKDPYDTQRKKHLDLICISWLEITTDLC